MLFFRWLPAVVVLAVLPLSTVTAEVYKWVDDAGNVHFGDSIPDKYKQTVKTVDVSTRRPTAAEQQQAEALTESARQAADAARERRLDKEERLEATAEQRGQAVAPKKASTPSLIKPSPGQARLTREQRMANYEIKMERYRESLRCFGKYQMKGGGTRGYAFNECTSVREPPHPDVQ